MQHVKPHGALYNMAAVNQKLSDAIAKAVYKVDPALVLFGLAESELVKAGNGSDFRRQMKSSPIEHTKRTAR